MSGIIYLSKKAKDLKYKINNAKDIIEKINYEIDFYNLLVEKAKLEKNYEDAVKYKKFKLQKELDYINLVEEQKEVKFIKLRSFLKKEAKDFEYVRTYIRVIDENLKPDNNSIGGMPVGVMVQFAARSYAGKTTTLIRIALNLAKSEKVVHFNYEMSEAILLKIYKDMTKTFVEPKQLDNLLLIEQPDPELKNLIRNIKLLNYREGVRFFIIDSRMKLKSNERTAKERASNISKQLSELVRELGITIILINQLSEEAIKENRIVLKESGDQEYDADLIMGLGYIYQKDGDKVIKDEMGQPKIVDDVRFFKCQKNRLGKPFEGQIHINEIFPQEAKEITPNMDMPQI